MSPPPLRPTRPTITPLKTILSPTSSSAPSRTNSPSMSRRSSSSGSSSGKCVHFPCNPAKMSSFFPTHSRDAYDRSPIIPSADDLDIPSCRSEETSWIKCLQRKAREAAKEGVAPPHTYIEPQPFNDADSAAAARDPALTSPRSDAPSSSHSHDGYSSSCSESDELGPLSSSSSVASSSTSIFSPAFAHCRTASLEMFMAMADRDEDAGRPAWDEPDDVDMVSADCEEEDETQMAEVESAKCERKLGMCALGKFTRESLFTNDAFGGF